MSGTNSPPDAVQEPALVVPARSISVPRHVSPVAKAVLAAPQISDTPSYPAQDDLAGWRAHAAQGDAHVLQMIGSLAARTDTSIETVAEDKAIAYQARPNCCPVEDRRVLL